MDITDTRLKRYRDLLLHWNDRVNLIGPEARANLDDHIEEALWASRLLEPRGRVMDVGSGGGLPAIPMAIVSPEATFHLVEADQRKWAFLKFVARECLLKCHIWGDRLQDLVGRLPPEMDFELVTSRAVGHTGEWVPLLINRIPAGGKLALFQASAAPPDLSEMTLETAHRLPRGTENWLVVMRHVPRGTA